MSCVQNIECISYTILNYVQHTIVVYFINDVFFFFESVHQQFLVKSFCVIVLEFDIDTSCPFPVQHTLKRN